MNGNGVGSDLRGWPKELVIGDIVETDLNEWPTKERACDWGYCWDCS